VADLLTSAESEILMGLDPITRTLAMRHRAAVLTEGLPFILLSGLRSRAQQAALADDPNRTTPAAAAGNSKHEVGAAYDLVRQSSAIESRVGVLAEALGLKWGGRFQPQADPNHFELPQTRAEIVSYRNLALVGLAAGLGLVLVFARDRV
jgi:hypothetical protein